MEQKQIIKGQALQPLSPEESRLHQWAESLLKRCLKQINKYKIIQPKPKLFVIRENERAFVLPCYDDSQTKKRIIAFNIHLPLKYVKRAKFSIDWAIELYSGKGIYVSNLTYLNDILFHEIIHCLFKMVVFNRKDIEAEYGGLEEGIATIFSQKQIINRKDGKLIIACIVSQLLIEANIIGCAEIRNINQINLPYKLSPESLELIQQELDVYFSQSELIRKKYLTLKEKNKGDDEDKYSRSFIELTRNPALYKRFIALLN